jgi:YHS domain-containing protein
MGSVCRLVGEVAESPLLHGGTWYYFDTLGCRSKFTARPDAYVKNLDP